MRIDLGVGVTDEVLRALACAGCGERLTSLTLSCESSRCRFVLRVGMREELGRGRECWMAFAFGRCHTYSVLFRFFTLLQT